MSVYAVDVWFERHHIQHYTNQLAKETNQYTRDLAHLPQINLSPSELVAMFCLCFGCL